MILHLESLTLHDRYGMTVSMLTGIKVIVLNLFEYQLSTDTPAKDIGLSSAHSTLLHVNASGKLMT